MKKNKKPEQQEWIVTVTGQVTEQYVVSAESEEDALANWHKGTRCSAESHDCEATSAEPNV